MNNPVNETYCPLCSRNNACGAHGDIPCWCFSTTIPQTLIDQVPVELQMKACICKSCVERYYQTIQQQQ